MCPLCKTCPYWQLSKICRTFVVRSCRAAQGQGGDLHPSVSLCCPSLPPALGPYCPRASSPTHLPTPPSLAKAPRWPFLSFFPACPVAWAHRGPWQLCRGQPPRCPAWSPAYPSAPLCPQAGQLFGHGRTIFFSTFVSLWAVLFLEFWKWTNTSLAHHWDCSEFEDMEVGSGPLQHLPKLHGPKPLGTPDAFPLFPRNGCSPSSQPWLP